MTLNVLLASSNDALAVVPIVIIIFIGLAIVIRLGAGSMDDGRIREHIEQQSGKIQSIDWAPFGRGWAGSKNERIYEVVYEDAQHNIHKAYCKTNALAGVYWTEDTIITPASGEKSQTDTEGLAAENQRLREEVEQLKKQS